MIILLVAFAALLVELSLAAAAIAYAREAERQRRAFADAYAQQLLSRCWCGFRKAEESAACPRHERRRRVPRDQTT